MRTKVIIPVLLVGSFFLAVAAFVHFRTGTSPNGRLVARLPRHGHASLPVTVQGPALSQPDAFSDAAPKAPDRAAEDADATNMRHEEFVNGKIVWLQNLAMTSDPAALQTILAELSNPEERIRQAAVAAAVQFGSADAIPVLEDAAYSAQTPQEQAAIQKAIELLRLAPLSATKTPAP